MIDRFFGLRHNIIIGCNHNDRNICKFRTTSAHGGKSFVTRCIKKCDFMTALSHYIICADVLSNTTCFRCSNFRIAYIIQ